MKPCGDVNSFLFKNGLRAPVVQFSRIHRIGYIGRTFTSYSSTPFITLEGLLNSSLQNEAKHGRQEKKRKKKNSGVAAERQLNVL